MTTCKPMPIAARLAKTATLLSTSLALLPGCEPLQDLEVGSKPQMLVGGEPTQDDEAVVALTTSSGGVICSGTLISPSVVLTAAHCIDDAGNDPSIAIFFGPDAYGPGTKLGVKSKQQQLGWTGGLAGGHDIGVLLLNFPHPNRDLPMKLNTSSQATDHIGDSYRHVGFGRHDRVDESIDGQKRQGTTTISEIAGDVIRSGDAALSVCFGDSGGPGLLTIDDEEVVAGVHSYTTGNCNAPNGDTRVELYADEFVIPWIQDNDPTCGEDGYCAPIGCIDDVDCLPCGPDGTCTNDCALPDPDCPTSGLGDICQASTQCTTELCVFWQLDLDYHFCSQECEPTNDTCPDGMSCQSVMPFGYVCYYDDDPPGVLGDGCERPTDCGSYMCVDNACVVTCDLSIGDRCPEGFECTPATDGDDHYCTKLPSDEGCGCTAGSPQAATLPALLLLAAAVLRGRRRRRN